MPIVYECDGCGKREEATHGYKPRSWFERDVFVKDAAGKNMTQPKRLVVCSRECVGVAAKKYGIDDVVAPI